MDPLSLNRKVDRYLKMLPEVEPPEDLLWGPPRSESDYEDRVRRGYTPDTHPMLFWGDSPTLQS